MFASAETGYSAPQKPGFISTFSPLAEARSHYNRLKSLCDELQQEKADLEEDFKLSGKHPEFYANPKGQAYLEQARTRHPKLMQEIENIQKRQRAILSDCPDLKKRLERELYGNGHDSDTSHPGDKDVPPGQQPQSSGLTLLSDVAPQSVKWLWPGRIPLGKLSVVDGDPGLGKSLLSTDIGARVSTARAMPDGTESDLDEPAGVVVLSAEDDLTDTIRPRLEAARADLSRVVALTAVTVGDDTRMPMLSDLAEIRAAITRVNAKLVIIDPLMAYLPGKVDSHRDQDVRRSLAPLAALAAETGVAVLVVRHLNKNESKNAVYRGGGSIGIIGAARSGLLVAKDPDDEDLRVLAVTKSNLAKTPPSLAYRIVANADEVPSLVWEGATDHTAAALLAQPADGEDRSALEDAQDFLREVLAKGPRPAKEVIKEADQAGVAERTLRRARVALGINPSKTGRPGEEEQQWTWSLPPKVAKGAEDGQQKKVDTFGKVGPLREPEKGEVF